ncbi:MAG: EAL domain-containing protein [Steroidobacteraceae bacterium]
MPTCRQRPIAPSQLIDHDWVDTLRSALQMYRLPPEQLQIEITESASAEGAQVEQLLRRISALGVRIALDDFGTGYSSLSELHRLPIDVVKIDQSFVAELPENVLGVQLLNAIVSMAHGLGHEVIVEGVETEAQRQLLAQIGCDAMQGYLFARPLPESELRAALVAADRRARAAGG